MRGYTAGTAEAEIAMALWRISQKCVGTAPSCKREEECADDLV